ncbi:mechanosensitive ion channel family protein [Deinococcus marmoris]|uniref:Potassium efflux system KefA protein / Small-conductance mechanosensitive channel n=1 Tax=Deinococcus marmoris TaxID=249408 RepID=A0A1U7P2F9_9DEIO|nr:mechanosensitive ion channel family protein [Deinococcus marmoris]OLV19351.1 Potassium efflux system KefA protein / Small-conductance mechanosensitive channel [Deinococcus marmoris]
MLDILLVQLSKPSVWLWLAIALVISYAVHRFGRILLKTLRDQVGVRMLLALKWLWLAVVVVGYVAYATYKIYLPDVPVLFGLGQSIAEGFRNTAGQAVVIVALALIAWRMVGTFSQRIVAEDDEFNRRNVRVQTLKGVVESTLKVIIIIISLIAGLQALGVNATSLLAGVSVLGLAVGFGAQSLIKDVFTGFFILLEDQYGVGDVITVNNGTLSGNVEKLNLRLTALRALDGTVHLIPNGQINTVSVSSKDWSRVVATVDVTYAANINEALRVLKSVSDEIYNDQEWKKFFLEEPDIQGVTQLAADGVTLRALFKVLPKSQYAVGREFNRRIKIAMDQAGIEIPFPQRSLNFGGAPIEIRLTRDSSGPDLKEQNRTQSPIKPSQSRDPEDED